MEYSHPVNLIVLYLCLLKPVISENSSGLLNVVPRSQNVSIGSDVMFSCGTNDSSLDIIWFFSSNIAASVLNEQLVEGGSVSKVLVKAVVPEYNESTFTCYLLNGTNFKVLLYEQVLLLIQGLLAEVEDLIITKQDPCSISLSWVSPYSLAGVPILGYNITVTTRDVPLMSVFINTTYYKFVPLVLSETYTIEISALNEVDEGTGTSLNVSYTRDINNSIIQNYYWNGEEWELVFNLTGLCINSSIDNTQFKICESITNCSTISLNNTQYINYTTTLYSTVIMTAKLLLPENRLLTLSFVIEYSNGQEMESSLFTINTHDIQNISVTDIDRGKVCILLTYRYNSKAIGAYIILIHNESDTNVTKEIYLNMSMCCESKTCLTGLLNGNYTLYIYDLESQSGSVMKNNKVPAVMLTSLEVLGSIPTTTNKPMDTVLSTTLTVVPVTMETTMTQSVTTTVTISTTINVNSIIIISVGGCVFVLLILSILLSLVLIYICCISVQHRGDATLPRVEVVNAMAINDEEPPPIPEYLEMEQCPAYGTVNHKWRYRR